MSYGLRGLFRALGICFIILLSSARAEPVEGRFALVIGEAGYANMPPLHSCAISAQVIASRLRQRGFDVLEHADASNGAVSAALDELARRIAMTSEASVTIYFCGYSLAYDDRVFLLPTTAFLTRPSDILTQGIPAQSVIDLGRRGSRVSLTVFDAYDRDAATKPGSPDSLAGLIRAQTPAAGHFVLAATEVSAGETATPLAESLAAALTNPPVELGPLVDGLRRSLPEFGVGFEAVGSSIQGGSTALAPRPSRAAPTEASIGGAVTASPPPAAGSMLTQQRRPVSMPEEDQYTALDRRRIQAALRELGYYDGVVDGVIGPDTRAAVRRYQHELHASMTGRLTPEQASRLIAGLAQPEQ